MPAQHHSRHVRTPRAQPLLVLDVLTQPREQNNQHVNILFSPIQKHTLLQL